MNTNHYLLVVLIVEGRRFPKKANQQLILESRFDGELLSTDPVAHVEAPVFNSELAWEVSKKLLHQYKLQRTPIKLQCYVTDLQTKRKESAGYILLDLRTADKQDGTSAVLPLHKKWYHLLNSKYSRMKPELLIGLSLEVDTGPKEESFQAKAAPARRGKVLTPDGSSESSLDPGVLAPVLNNAEGFFQIGPPDKCCELFILSVTVVFASNLTELVPTTIPLPHRESGFFFFYQLFGNDVTNEIFKDLINPSFACERASVHLRSNVEVLRAFFEKEAKLEINLCCGDQILGSAIIQMDQLLSPPSDVINQRPVSIEGAFPLTSPSDTKEKKKGGDGAVVGVSIVLRRKDISLPDQQPQNPPGSPGSCIYMLLKIKNCLYHINNTGRENAEQRRGAPLPLGNQKRARHSESDEDTDRGLDSLIVDDKIPQRDTTKGVKHASNTRYDVDGPPARAVEGSTEGSQQQQPHHHQHHHQHHPNTHPSLKQQPSKQHVTQLPVLPGTISHYGFSVDIRSIRNVNTSSALNIYIRYSYPFFGRSAPIMTHPSVEILNKHMEVYLPNSFCAFDFATTGQQLHDNLTRVPLMLELWHRDKQTKDLLLGVAEVPLSNVLSSARVPVNTINPPEKQVWRQICSEKVIARSVNENPTPVAEVLVALGLEDYGPINTKEVFLSSDLSQRSKETNNNVDPRGQEKEAAGLPNPRESMEYKTALELEMWKEQQADLFENQMKEKQVNHLQSLSEEFKRRDKERELLLKKKLDAYSHLEEQLQFALGDVVKRERELKAKEEEVGHLKDELQHDHEIKLTEMQEASRRMKEDCIHQIELEKGKNNMLQEQIEHLRERVKKLQEQIEQKDRQFEVYKEQNTTKPEMKLQSEISLLNLEKVELERKLDSLSKSKIHYKQQWGRALKELAHLKERQQLEAKARLQRQHQELEHMRLRYLAAEEKEVTKSDNQTLEDIKGELQRLKEQELIKKEKQPLPLIPAQQGVAEIGPKTHFVDQHSSSPLESADDHVARLIEERDTLLRTGVYSHQDRIIVELDRKLNDALTQSGT
ncbi:putative centrosomal protein [Apostichopus japonicus]|uniref:Putative centrosomal protein n=1 Tax=Stichopus japonicus TaxID=307972 RepID=A0A2G8KGT5_STIJA|nr:putative centrosomal protein [Apostichopus japonicus]